jgi:hypothetical protein
MEQQNKGVPGLEAHFEEVLKRFPKRKEELLKTIGKRALETVRGYINRSVRDPEGFITNGQVEGEGSNRGYVSIHAKYEKGAGRDSVKPVTTFLNNGHIIRRKKGNDGWYEGRMFYADSIYEINRNTEAAVKELEEKLKDDLS